MGCTLISQDGPLVILSLGGAKVAPSFDCWEQCHRTWELRVVLILLHITLSLLVKDSPGRVMTRVEEDLKDE